MQMVRTLMIAAAAAVQLHHPPARPDPVLVTSVISGDTLQVAAVGRVRLLGIEAPKTTRGSDSDQPSPFGREAKARLSNLVLHRWVRLEHDESGRADAPTRHHAYVVTEDGQFVNEVLVREGLARVSTRRAIARLAELQRAEEDARTYRRGIWSRSPPR
jgi:micrococcal nuclease